VAIPHTDMVVILHIFTSKEAVLQFEAVTQYGRNKHIRKK
jgi:hypothetical protein